MTSPQRLNVASILVEEEHMTTTLIHQGMTEEDAKRQALQFIKTKYSQVDN